MRKKSIRIIAIIIVVIMIVGIFSSVISMIAWAAGEIKDTYMSIIPETGSNKYTIKFTFTDSSMASTQVSSPSLYIESDSNISIDLDKITVKQFASDLSIFEVEITNATITQMKNSMNLNYTVKYNDANKTEAAGAALYRQSEPVSSSIKVITADTTVSKNLTIGKVSSPITITFNFLGSDESDFSIGSKITFDRLSMPDDSSFGWGKDTSLTIKGKTKSSSNDDIEYYQATLSGVSYTGGSTRTLELTVDGDTTFTVPIPNKYFTNSAAEEEDKPPTSDIVVQSVHVLDSEGRQLSSVTKDTPPFSVRITFYDVGLKDVGKSVLKESPMRAFITSAAGFKTLGGTVGEVEHLTSNAEYPRFSATFHNLTSDGTGTALGFRVQYDLKEYDTGVKGEATANLFQVANPEEESSKDEATPLKPNVIVQEYVYTTEEKPEIMAGDEFELELKICNTSKTTGVENIVMTVEPSNGFVIAAASNTVYFPSIAPSEVKPFSIALRALPSTVNTANTSPTDYSVQIKFSYQYMSAKNKYEGPVESGGKIAIPVSQLDRFAVEEITEYSQMLVVGEEGSITVPVINKGKSLIYNISGFVRAEEPSSFISPVMHIGNLEAGKSGSVDLSIIVNVPGEFICEAVVSYEDENSNEKEIATPITIIVNEPYIPPPEAPPDTDINTVNPQGPSAVSIVSCVAGALMIAAPICLYLIKRAKSRGIEDIDEDF